MYRTVTTESLPVVIDPEIMGGVPVFAGTRVPVQTLFDYLMEGCALGSFWTTFRPSHVKLL